MCCKQHGYSHLEPRRNHIVVREGIAHVAGRWTHTRTTASPCTTSASITASTCAMRMQGVGCDSRSGLRSGTTAAVGRLHERYAISVLPESRLSNGA